MDGLQRAGELAVAEAERLWQLDVYDPSRTDQSPRGIASKAVITKILKDAGWGFATPYRGNGPPQWCGLFAAACWRHAGLDPKWLATYWASTYRLVTWGKYQRFDAKHPNPPPADKDRRVLYAMDENSKLLGTDVRIGDILIVGDGEPDAGDHITLVTKWDPIRRVFSTLSGNGAGIGPDGKRREGIVRADFRLGGGGYCARFLIRPAFGDLLAEQA